MSPEQLRGDTVDGRSDLFSLGAMLYNLIAGSPPFEGSDLASIASQVLYKHPRPLSERSPRIPAESGSGPFARAREGCGRTLPHGSAVGLGSARGAESRASGASDLSRQRHRRPGDDGEPTATAGGLRASHRTGVAGRAAQLVSPVAHGRYRVSPPLRRARLRLSLANRTKHPLCTGGECIRGGRLRKE